MMKVAMAILLLCPAALRAQDEPQKKEQTRAFTLKVTGDGHVELTTKVNGDEKLYKADSMEEFRKQYPDVKVVVLSATTDENVIRTVLKRGASAYIVKSINPIDLPSALRQAVEGTVYSAIGLPEADETAARAAGLTDREAAILSALARGLSNEAIGKELWVAKQTVKFHLTNIYRKLGVSNRTEATRYAYEHGLVEPEPDSALTH